MKTESLIETMDSVGTRNIYKAYKAAFLGKGKPSNCPDKFWENIKVWDNFSDVNNEDKSVFELDKESADQQIKENQSGMKQKYLQDALKLAKDNDKLVGGSKEAKKDVEIMKERIKEAQSGKDMEYLNKKRDLAAKYEEDYKKQSTENMSEKDKRKNMEISQKDFNKLMSAMNKINKHFAEDEEEKVEDEVVEDENEEVSEDESEDAEVETEEEVDANAEEETETIELPTDVADAIRAALDEADEDEDEESDEEVVEEDEEVAEDEDEENEEVEDEEESESETEEFSEKFYKFSEAITETIENLDKKADKLADEIQENAEDKVIEFSKKDFIKFAESITNTIEGLAERLNAIEIPVKNEVTKDLSNLENTADDYEEEFVTKSDEETPENPVCPECNQEPCVCPTDPVANDTPENFSKRYANVKDFLTL